MITHSKMKFSEGLSFNDGKIKINPCSGRLVGKVQIDELDANGNIIFSSTETNDVILPGSVFVLEQMFKVCKDGERFLHPVDAFKTSYESSVTMTKSNWNQLDDIQSILNKEKIFGFMVGTGGEDGSSVIAPKYGSQNLQNSNAEATFVPFIIKDSGDTEDVDKYAIKISAENKDYYYAKRFDKQTGIKIYSKWADGSGDVNAGEEAYSTPIVTYAEAILEINEHDVRDYFGQENLSHCEINQLGLVAGYPIDNEETDFDDVKLITCVNFKARDLSSTSNKLRITYRVYCL